MIAAVGAAALATATTWAAQGGDPPAPPPPSFDGKPPADVAIPAGFSGNPIDYFDDFSWRAFMAVVWPSLKDDPGAPDPAADLDGPGVKVFETYRTNWQVFQPDGSPPSAWGAPSRNSPCANVVLKPDDLLIAGFSKFEELGLAGFGELTGPLVAQNRTYLRFSSGYNRSQFEHIVDEKLYLRETIEDVTAPSPTPKTPPPSPAGSVVVKSAWMDMTGVKDPQTYYSRLIWVVDPASGNCVNREFGLVGLHIVSKTPSRPQWIWTTFEHVDLAPAIRSPPGGPYPLNDGSGKPMLNKNPNTMAGIGAAPPNPHQVERVWPIHDATGRTNAKWRQALAAKASVWANYQLVMTQWPTTPNAPNLDAGPDHTFPGRGNDKTSFANVALETYDQKRITTGCMACHDSVRQNTDFVWSIETHAYPRPAPSQAALFGLKTSKASKAPRPAESPALKRLRGLLQDAARN